MTEPDGILLINKPQGLTSHDVVWLMRRILGTKKTGHTGTLDPDATGLLVVLVGRAAKAAEYMTSDRKRYRAVMRLGLTTDTQDAGGHTLTVCDTIPDADEVVNAINSFVGEIEQVPPMYSALKVDGKKLVDLARRGITVERQARAVHIFGIDTKQLSNNDYQLTVDCSGGTYIRTLCDDIGAYLGCGAVMAELCRLGCGGYSLDDAIGLDELSKLDGESRLCRLLPTETLFSDLPIFSPQGFFLHLCKSGAEIYQHKTGISYDVGQRVRLYDEQGFFALGEVMEFEDGTAVKPIKVFRL